jgi:hypothetical protein
MLSIQGSMFWMEESCHADLSLSVSDCPAGTTARKINVAHNSSGSATGDNCAT